MIGPVPTIGRIVHYTLTATDAEAINRRRRDAIEQSIKIGDYRDGVTVHVGNAVEEGEIYPMMIVRVWGDRPESAVNGQVHLDGNDLHWVTSTQCGTGPRTWAWPVMA